MRRRRAVRRAVWVRPAIDVGQRTHEAAHLGDGFVFDGIIECPKHNGRFDIRTGKARGAPVCIDLKVYLVRLENGKVLIDID